MGAGRGRAFYNDDNDGDRMSKEGGRMAAGLSPREPGSGPLSAEKGGCREASANGEQRGRRVGGSSENTLDKEGLRNQSWGDPEGSPWTAIVPSRATDPTGTCGSYLHVNEVQIIYQRYPKGVLV